MTDPCYRAPPAGTLSFEPLGDVTAIFDRRSMQTHLVIAPLPEILTAMAGENCTPDELAARLALAFDLGEQGDFRPILKERLDELTTMGLIERG